MNLNSITETIDKLLWGWPQIILLLGTHLFMSFRTGFIQKDIFKAIRLSVKKDPDAPGDVSQFGALTTALASTVGTANIIGVGTAIALGGPGAVLWIWFTGLFGIATKYAETIIAIKYRVRSEDGTMLGGAMYALDRGLNMKWLGIIFAILASVCGLGIGCSVPANAVVSIIKTNFASDESSAKTITYVTAVILCTLVGVAIIGGVKSKQRYPKNLCLLWRYSMYWGVLPYLY